jgi:cation diffusion facilitator CzcD-associated flavoprotein CzcO
MDSKSDALYDLCVIGGGTSGIASARFYLDVHPTAKVMVLERDHSVGGVWSKGILSKSPS